MQSNNDWELLVVEPLDEDGPVRGPVLDAYLVALLPAVGLLGAAWFALTSLRGHPWHQVGVVATAVIITVAAFFYL